MLRAFLLVFAFVSLFALGDNTADVKLIFDASCVKCHGGAQPIKFNILDVKELADKGVVQGGAESKLYKSLNRATQWMPLGSEPLSIEQKTHILDWLNAGYPAFDVQQPAQDPIDYGDEVECMYKDLSFLPEHKRRYTRYLLFSRYYNEGGIDNLNRALEGANKILNSTSFSPHITKLAPVEGKGVKEAILRLDLEDFNLEAADWDNFVVRGKYPYFIFYFDKQNFGFFEDKLFVETECVKGGYCQTLPFVRGDWFVSYVSQPPLYYDALFKRKDIRHIKDLEAYLGVDTQEQLFKTYEARRAISRRSGVTNYNRAIDHYNLDFWIGGAKYPSHYWKTFDTNGDKAQDKRNLFAFPFGPLYSWYSYILADIKDRAFLFDAEEVLWAMPNGSLGSWLSDGQGKRIDEALTEVAYHKSNTNHYIGSKPGAILAGVSCFACHSGMNVFKDEALSYIKASTDFSNAQVDFAKLTFYKDQAEITAHITDHNKLYAVAAKTMGAKDVVYVDTKEPIFSTAKQYFDDIGVCELGAELGFDCGEMKTRLLHAPELALLLGLGETLNGKVSRPNIEYLFAEIAKELNLGKQVVFNGHIDPPPVKCKLTLTNNTAYHQTVKTLIFSNNTTYRDFGLAPGASKVFEHDSQALATACRSYTQGWCFWNNNVSLDRCKSYGIVRKSDGKSYFQLINREL